MLADFLVFELVFGNVNLSTGKYLDIFEIFEFRYLNILFCKRSEYTEIIVPFTIF